MGRGGNLTGRTLGYRDWPYCSGLQIGLGNSERNGGGVTKMTGKLNVMGVGSATDFGVSFRVANSDFDSDLETSSGQGPTLG